MLNQKLLGKFEKWCKFTSHINAKSCKKEIAKNEAYLYYKLVVLLRLYYTCYMTFYHCEQHHKRKHFALTCFLSIITFMMAHEMSYLLWLFPLHSPLEREQLQAVLKK